MVKVFKTNYLWIILLLAGITSCLPVQDDSLLSGSQDKITLRVVYAETPGTTRGTAQAPQTEGAFYLNDSLCLEAVQSNHTPTAADSICTRGVLSNSISDIKSMNLMMISTLYADNFLVGFTFNVTGDNGDFRLTNVQSGEDDWAANPTEKRTFYAISPQPDTTNGITFSNDKKSITYIMPAAVDKQPDICVSDINKNKDLVNKAGSHKNNLTLEMSHALAAVGFEAVGWDRKITEVTISNILPTGEFNLISRTWTADASGAPMNCSASVTSSGMTSANVNQWVNITQQSGYLMVPPQAVTDDMVLTFKYERLNGQVDDTDDDQVYSVPLKEIYPEGSSPRWEAGKKCIYQLRLKTRPAVQDDVVNIYNSKGYYTSDKSLNISADSDDDLTFTWTEPWLKIHRGAPGTVSTAAGAASGWKTGVNNWKNLYFFSTQENPSRYVSREATVTVTGKKSGIRTFKVVHHKDWELVLQNPGTVNINTFKKGSTKSANSCWIDGDAPVNITFQVSAQGLGKGPSDKEWLSCTPRKVQDKTWVDMTYKWNIQAGYSRTATVTVKGTYGNVVKTKQFKVYQKSPNYWIALDDKENFKFGIYKNDINKYYSREEWRCVDYGYGDHLPYMGDEINTLSSYLGNRYWINFANFKMNQTYWSSSRASDAWFSARNYYFLVTGGGWLLTDKWFRVSTRWYRCVNSNESRIY